MIRIENLTDFLIDSPALKRIAGEILSAEKNPQHHLLVKLVNPDTIRKFNRDYRKKDKPTDVLSFPNLEQSEGFVLPLKLHNEVSQELGEIFICPEVVKENALDHGSTFERELSLILIHGILHLLGYDHETSAREAEIMEKKQQKYLLSFFRE